MEVTKGEQPVNTVRKRCYFLVMLHRLLCVRTQDEGYHITWVKGQVVLELVHNISVLCAGRIYTIIILYSLYCDTPNNCVNYISIHHLDLSLFFKTLAPQTRQEKT